MNIEQQAKYSAVNCSIIAEERYKNEPRRYQREKDYADGLEHGYGHALFEHAAPLEAALIAERTKASTSEGDQLSEEDLRDRIAQAHRVLHTARIWGGTGWKWNDLPPFSYKQAIDHLDAALELLRDHGLPSDPRRSKMVEAIRILLQSRGCWSNGGPEIPEEISGQFDIGLDDARHIINAVTLAQ